MASSMLLLGIAAVDGSAAPAMPAGIDAVSLIQTRLGSKRASPAVDLDESMDTPFWREMKALETTTFLDGVPIFKYDRVFKGRLRPRNQWILVYYQNTTHHMIRNGCRRLRAPAACDHVSRPERGELAYAVVHAHERELKASRMHTHIPFATKYIQLDGQSRLQQQVRQGPFVIPSVADTPVPWGLDRIDGGMDGKPYGIQYGGQGVHVWNMDTGVQEQLAEFGAQGTPPVDRVFDVTPGVLGCMQEQNLNPFKQFFQVIPKVCKERQEKEMREKGKLGSCSQSCGLDKHGHGTHTTSNICGAHFGVAKAATCHGMKVLNDQGIGAWSWFVEGINFVLTQAPTHKPSIISGSLGGPGIEPFVKDAVDKATAADVSVVVAAGNDGHDACVSTPGFIESAVVIGATERDDNVAQYSNWGKCVDLFAPGTGLPGFDNHGNELLLSGTSQSCPLAAGAMALEMSIDGGQPLPQPAGGGRTLSAMSMTSGGDALASLKSQAVDMGTEDRPVKLLQVHDRGSQPAVGFLR